MKSHRNGNALFLILIAIFLLGGLTVLLARTSGTTEETGSTEQASIAASSILNYAASVKAGVTRLIQNGCGEAQIHLGYTNTNSPTDGSCHVFDARGAGIAASAAKDNWFDPAWTPAAVTTHNSFAVRGWYYPSTTCVTEVGTGGVGCQASPETVRDLIITINFLKKDVCMAINRSLGVANVSDDAPACTGCSFYHTTWPRWQGTFTGTSAMIGISPYLGIKTMCYKTGTSSTSVAHNTYSFYSVLLAR